MLCCSTNVWLIVLLVHPLSTNAEVEILVIFSRVLIWMLTTRSFSFPLSLLMYRFGCHRSSSHQRALIHVAFCIPSIISSTTSSICILWIQFFKIAFASNSILASTIPCKVHSAPNGLSHLCRASLAFMSTCEGSTTIGEVTAVSIEGVKLVFLFIQKLVSSSSLGISYICTLGISHLVQAPLFLSIGVSCTGSIKSSVFTKAPWWIRDLDFSSLMVVSIPRGGFAEAIPLNPPARLELYGAVLSGGMLSVCSPAPSSGTIMMGVTMVGDLSFNAFTCDGLLAKRLASSLTIMAYCTVDWFLLSSLSGCEVTGIFECMVDTTNIWVWLAGMTCIPDEAKSLAKLNHLLLSTFFYLFDCCHWCLDSDVVGNGEWQMD